MEVVLTKSKKPDEKYDARIDGSKTVSFGQKMASDFIKHKHTYRKEAYLARHKNNENGGACGVKAAGFWSANLLWNRPTLKASIDDIDKGFKGLNAKKK